MVLTARGGWATTRRTATSLTTLPVSTLVTTVGAALGLLQAPRPSSQHVGSIAIFNLVLCPCLLHLSRDCRSAAPLGVFLLVTVLLLCHALPLTPGGPTGQRSSPLLMLTHCSCHCPQSVVGRYPRSSGSSVMLWATSGSPGTHGIEQGRNHLSVRDAR